MRLKAGEPRWVYVIFLIGLFTFSARLILGSGFANSALIYVAIPFLISLAIFQLTRPPQDGRLIAAYLGHLRIATIIMLATSAILFEGFICVLFFMPIYFLIITLDFFIRLWAQQRKAKRDAKFQAAVWPLLIMILSVEGLSPSTSFERANSITRSVIIDANVEKLKTNMSKPIELPQSRHWFLSIFPLPVDVKAGSLDAGDVHTMDFVYKRWFFTNVKRGEFHLKIDSVSDSKVTTSVIKNTSYLSTYLEVKGTEVNFKPLGTDQTEVALTIHYERRLDPAWYFAPMQEFAIGQSADYLIQSVIVREKADE